MASLVDEQQQWFDETTNTPIVNGFIYVGNRNADPRVAKAIFSDRELTTPLANPQLTDSAGRSVNKIWTEGRYSIEVANSDDVQKYIELDNGEGAGAGVIALGDVQGANTITATAATTITAYEDLQQYVFRTSQINTGAVTLNIDSVGAKSVVKDHDQPIQNGNFEADQNIIVTYNATDDVFEWANQNIKATSSYSGTTIPSAAAITIPTDGNYFVLTGTVTVATINVGTNRDFTLQCDGDITFTNGASIVTEDGNDVVVSAGSIVMFKSTADNVSRVTKIPTVVPTNIVLGTPVETTTGTSIDFTGIPAGTKRVTVNFDGVSTNGSSNLLIQLGDSGGFETTGYLSFGVLFTTSANFGVGSTVGFITRANGAGDTRSGAFIFSLENEAAFTWTGIYTSAISTTQGESAGGVKSLSSELTQIRITTVGGADTFDAGEINISYEGN